MSCALHHSIALTAEQPPSCQDSISLICLRLGTCFQDKQPGRSTMGMHWGEAGTAAWEKQCACIMLLRLILYTWIWQPQRVGFFTRMQGRPALVFGDAVYLRLASNPAEETAAAIVAMRSTQAFLALPPSFLQLLTAVRQPCLIH
jgi:hypothetical protein